VAGSTATVYVTQGITGSVLSEIVNGAWSKDYIYLGGQLLATESSTLGTRYHFSDHLGTPRLVVNDAGGIICNHDYYPFGQERTVCNDGETHKFTGQERDAESTTDYFRARQYAYSLGRFLQPDEFTGGPVDAFSANDPLPPGPLPYADITNPQSLNKYAYTYNNPLNYVDPDGHDAATTEVVNVTVRVVAVILESGGEAGPVLTGAGAAAAIATGVGIGVAANVAINAYADRVEAEADLKMEEHKAANDVAQRNAEAKTTEGQAPEAEPQAEASGAGARKGGGRDARKIDFKREQSARENIERLRQERDALRSKANKTRADKENLKRTEKALRREIDRMRKSETHGRKPKGPRK
jgi:RHS repeat-associated protein